ncbi:hypothetical protein PILCRDRAFT_735823 [Piloderma croceum F 1598]|uniref:Uncharacterized protein n=1 Tax=Piloderma croceum (strain F 1598) TaxID=765440 RepID=A0A0C3B6E0_PILCF|nr:hypothetical protein PILCRDRAFT_735823 [Piloderma croceum F 1598]
MAILVFLPIGGGSITAVILLLKSSPPLGDRSYPVLALGYPATGRASDLHWRDVSRRCSAYIGMGCEYKGMGR